MLYSSGYSKTLLNDDIVNEASWDLHPVDDDEFNMNIDMNGKKYEFRNFEIEDLNDLLSNNHTTDDLSKQDNELFDNHIIIKPYPKYSYKITPKKKGKKKKKTLKKKKRKTTPKRCLRKCKNSKKSYKKKQNSHVTSKAKVKSTTIY
jgi:hypothetical protein